MEKKQLSLSGSISDGRSNHVLALDVSDVATLLGVTPKAVRHRVDRGLIPFHRHGGKLVFFRDEVEAFFRNLPGCSVDEARQNLEMRDDS